MRNRAEGESGEEYGHHEGATTTGPDATPPELSVKTWGGGSAGGGGGGRLEGLGGGGLEGRGGEGVSTVVVVIFTSQQTTFV